MFTKSVRTEPAEAAETAAATRTGTRHRRPSRGGFTLAEILAVVVILGIASAIIIPQIGSRDDMRTAAAARTVVADLIYAQNLAISSGTNVYVRFDVANNRYSVLTAPLSSKPKFGDPVTHPITQSDYVQQFGPSGQGWAAVSIQSAAMNGIDVNYRPEFTVGFDEIGSPYVWCYDLNSKNELNDGTIVIKAGTMTKTVTVSPATGEILVN